MALVELKEVTKRFPPYVTALDSVNFSVGRGEIHCLLGENGAGKTTLMNILYGLYKPTEGTVNIEGRQVKINSPSDAINHGIGMVHQHFLLIPQHTVVENVALGLKCNNQLFPLPEARRLIEDVGRRYGLTVNPDSRIWQLSSGEQQRVEIVKALCRNVQILILDEPTSILTPLEAETLFKALQQMADDGKTVIFITHKLDEVMSISDNVTVLRKGKHVATVKTSKTNKRELARMMVGREVLFSIGKNPVETGNETVNVKELHIKNESNQIAVKNVGFKIREGEILGIAGVAGNGQSELVEALTGLRTITSGSFTLSGMDVTNKPPTTLTGLGVAHIPEDRIARGVVPDMSVEDNLLLRDYKSKEFSKGLLLDYERISDHAEKMVKEFNIDTPDLETPVKLLSGGNIQKVILARELSGSPRFVVASHPTYGLDVGATEQIRQRLLDQREKGSAILLVSEDLEEVFELSDRIAVMYEGEFLDVMDRVDANVERVGLLMAGIMEADA